MTEGTPATRFAALSDDELRRNIDLLIGWWIGDEDALAQLHATICRNVLAAMVEAEKRDLSPGPRAAALFRTLGVQD